MAEQGARERRFSSGIRALSIDALVERRREIARNGVASGRWDPIVGEVAQHLAKRPEIPHNDEAWTLFLDGLFDVLEPCPVSR